MSSTSDSPQAFTVKICGFTTAENAREAARCGADEVGFNIHPGSKRHVDPAQAMGWIANLPAEPCRVLVAVDSPLDTLREMASLQVFGSFQLHGAEPPGVCRELAESGARVVKALPARNEDVLERIAEYHPFDILLDAVSAQGFGGTGRTIDWSLAARCVQAFPHRRIILSGGLHPGNVADAVRTVQPSGVDTASGVESAPGIKNPRLMRSFIKEAKSAFSSSAAN